MTVTNGTRDESVVRYDDRLPVRGRGVRIEEFEHDVSGVFLPASLSVGDEPDTLSNVTSAAWLCFA